jgi:hypothetical protein
MRHSIPFTALVTISTISLAAIGCGSSGDDGAGSATGAFSAPSAKPSAGAPASPPAAKSAAPATASPAAKSLCTDQEQTVFACPTDQNKQIAVCAAKDDVLQSMSGYMQYRFGTAAKVELSLPADSDANTFASITEHSNLMFAGGGGHYIRFSASDGKTSYVVYSAIGEGFDEAGVAAEVNRQMVGHHKCIGSNAGFVPSDLDGFFNGVNVPEGEADLDFPLPTK